jgi:[ribosomal protein S18]-alanine N-acetyltransferase
VVRRAGVEDLEGVLWVEQETREAPHWDEARYRAMLQDGGQDVLRRVLFVAVDCKRVVGFAAGAVVLEEAELESVAVDDAWRRCGVGRALSEAVFGWAGTQGAKQVRLEVRAANEAAQALYRGLGFETCGMRRGYYVDPVDDAVLMTLTLH